MDESLDQFAEVETGEAFTLQNPRLLKVELSETTVMARNGAMVAYQGDVRFEHKGGGLSRLIKKAATGESLQAHAGERLRRGVPRPPGDAGARDAARQRQHDRQRGEHPRLRGGHRLGHHARQGRRGRDARRRALQRRPERQRAGGADVGRRAAAARRRRGADLRRSLGRHRLVGRRQHEPEVGRAGQVADRPGLRRELPARPLRSGLGADPALRGPLHADVAQLSSSRTVGASVLGGARRHPAGRRLRRRLRAHRDRDDGRPGDPARRR